MHHELFLWCRRIVSDMPCLFNVVGINIFLILRLRLCFPVLHCSWLSWCLLLLSQSWGGYSLCPQLVDHLVWPRPIWLSPRCPVVWLLPGLSSVNAHLFCSCGEFEFIVNIQSGLVTNLFRSSNLIHLNDRSHCCCWYLCCRLYCTDKMRCWIVNATWPWFITYCLKFLRIFHMRHWSAEPETSLSSSLHLNWLERLLHMNSTSSLNLTHTFRFWQSKI